MATLIALPHELQTRIVEFLAPTDLQRPLVPRPAAAKIHEVHRNLKVPLYKMAELRARIHEWRQDTSELGAQGMQFKYQYGPLTAAQVRKGWVDRIKAYRAQACFVATVYGILAGEKIERAHKVIFFEVNFEDLKTGIRGLPPVFGRAPLDYRIENGSLRLQCARRGGVLDFIETPSCKTHIPEKSRRQFLLKCFMNCILVPFMAKIFISKNPEATAAPSCKDFRWNQRDFKIYMGLHPDCKFSQTDLFKIFLEELGVGSDSYYSYKLQQRVRTQTVEQLCTPDIHLLE